ncbi:P-loop containing nucleoside triphosphate hydrolase protein [Mycena rebaudengoi]|nr:P-loop containing nucleoside triphosphate hydrolase protein [Mycena rebaudengoi]
MDSDDEFQLATLKDVVHDDSSSVMHTPPVVSYTNLAGPSHSKAKTLRREPSGLVDCHRVLTKTFGHSEYKGKQREIVEAAIRGADIFVLAPTGMGKSLCFQVPAVADKHGVTIVVSPLLALMKNQVAGLREKQVPVASLTSETSASDKKDIVRDLSSGHPVTRLLYITPEKLCTAEFMQLLETIYRQKELNRLVIDEAHCISEWGHDFRSEYRRLGQFRKRFKEIPIMALTATATAAVQLDIIRSLGMSEEHLYKVIHPFNRANLFYEVRYLSAPNPVSQMADICDYIFTLYQRRERPSSGIIYCRTRASCDELSNYLRGRGLNSRPYHRGIPSKTLDRTLKDWSSGGAGNGGVDVVCATIAFGLGIDKGDVRYIIHYDLPKSLEGYYQETGRAGRDGSPSKCILYYSREDVIRVKRWVTGSHARRTNAADKNDGPAPSQRAVESLSSLVQFAESTTICRHVSICRYFGEPIDAADEALVRKYCNKMCDICKYPDKTKRRHEKLSSEEYAGTQVPQDASRDYDEDDSYPAHAGPSRVNSNGNNSNPSNANANPSVWKKNFRDAAFEENQAGNYKRPRTEQNGKMGYYNKKARTSSSASYGAVLVSKPFPSVGDLKKPFRTPFLVPRPVVEERGATPPQEPEPEPEAEFELDFEPDMQIIENVQTDSSRPSSPVDLPDADIALDVSFSQKIEASLRHSALTSIRKALHKVFVNGADSDVMWGRLSTGVPEDADARNEALNGVGHALEFTAHSLCSTAEGYARRVDGTVEGIKFLGRSRAVWNEKEGEEEEWDDAREVLKCFVVKDNKFGVQLVLIGLFAHISSQISVQAIFPHQI